MSLRRPNPPNKGGSAPEEEEERVDWFCLDQLRTGGKLFFTRLWIWGLRGIREMSSKGERQYRDDDKSLVRPGRKQARKHFRDARDFNNVETRAVIKFLFPAKQGAEGDSHHSDRKSSLFPSWPG